MTRELMQRALDALLDARDDVAQAHVEAIALQGRPSTDRVRDVIGAQFKRHEAVIAEMRLALAVPAGDKPATSEPVAWRLGHRFYSDKGEAEFDWRNDGVFDNTGYCPEPLYAATPDVQPGWALVPVAPTFEIERAMWGSVARDDEGSFPCLGEHLDYTGENKALCVIRAAYRAAIAAAQKAPT